MKHYIKTHVFASQAAEVRFKAKSNKNLLRGNLHREWFFFARAHRSYFKV
jgi:hypothetical protein